MSASNAHRQKFIESLRDIANFLEQNPTFHIPPIKYTLAFSCSNAPAIAEHARMFGHCRKLNGFTTIGMVRDFGCVSLKISWQHYNACKRVLVPGETSVEYVPVQTKRVESPRYKWVCPESFIKACCKDKGENKL